MLVPTNSEGDDEMVCWLHNELPNASKDAIGTLEGMIQVRFDLFSRGRTSLSADISHCNNTYACSVHIP